MSTFKTLSRSAFAVAVGAAITTMASASAFAQSTILVVDTSKVYQDSAVGQHIKRQMDTMVATSRTQLTSSKESLDTRQKNLQIQLDGKTEDQIRGDTALTSQLTSFQQDNMKLSIEAQLAEAEIKVTEQNARQLVTAKMASVIDQIAKERNADVVLEKQLVIYGEPADITSTVLARLNAQMTTVPVTRAECKLVQNPQQNGVLVSC